MTFDYLLVGGGLQNGLVALATLAARPEARIAIVDRGPKLGGNHTWCFHAGDLEPRIEPIVGPLIVRRWEGYDVLFPGLDRSVDDPYAAVTSERLAEVVTDRIRKSSGSSLFLRQEVTDVAPDHVVLASGERLYGRLVVDARGPGGFRSGGAVSYQKFLGLELELDSPSPRTRPLLMDARVPQRDGFRFFYILPLDSHRALVEETFFSDDPRLDLPARRASVIRYAEDAGFDVGLVAREESGVLPMPLRADSALPAPPLRAGYLGGWFHPTTAYSFPLAARLARFIASREPDAVFGDRLDELWTAHARQQRFACLLNRLLFGACAPEHRVDVLERFYRLPAATIRRFYALSTTASDRARIVCGRPPRGVALSSAIRGVLS